MPAVNKLIKRLGNEVKNIVKSALEISYFSRGAWGYHEVLMMSQGERELAVDFINERLKIASTSHFPVY
jgi:hypothetical protein